MNENNLFSFDFRFILWLVYVIPMPFSIYLPITIGTYPIDERNNSSGASSNVFFSFFFFFRKVDEIEPDDETQPRAPLLESSSSNTDQSNKIAEPKPSAPYPQAGNNQTSLYY